MDSTWPEKYTKPPFDIDFKELFTIVTATKTWGNQWAGKRIVFLTDNLPITQIWQAGSTKSHELMKLIGNLYLTAANFIVLSRSNMFTVSTTLLLILFLGFRTQNFEKWHRLPTSNQHHYRQTPGKYEPRHT